MKFKIREVTDRVTMKNVYLRISWQYPASLTNTESARYDLQMITFRKFRKATFIAAITIWRSQVILLEYS